MIKFDITGKATIGYIFMTAIIILAGWLVYGNTQSVMLINNAEEQFLSRRNLTDSMVYSVLDVNNKERAICLGLSDKLPEFNNAVERTLAIADSLKKIPGRRQRHRTHRLPEISRGTETPKHLSADEDNGQYQCRQIL